MPPDPKLALVTSPTIRNDTPAADDDWAEVVLVKGPIEITYPDGALHNGHETVVGAVAVSILAADPNRKTAVVQNVGGANVRVGVAGVTATTGLRLIPDAVVIYDMPFVATQELYAIREGASDSVVFAQEVT